MRVLVGANEVYPIYTVLPLKEQRLDWRGQPYYTEIELSNVEIQRIEALMEEILALQVLVERRADPDWNSHAGV